LSYEDRLRKLNLPTLEYRRSRGDAIEVYKYLHGIYRVDETGILFRHHTGGAETRGHSMKLMKRDCNSQIRGNVFGLRVVNAWNSLPQDVIDATTVNCFKGRYDSFNARACYGEQDEAMDSLDS